LNYLKAFKNLTLNELRIFLRSPGALFFALFLPLSIAFFMFFSSGNRGRAGLQNYSGGLNLMHYVEKSAPQELEKSFKGVSVERKGNEIIVRGNDPAKVKMVASFLKAKLYDRLLKEGKAEVAVKEVLTERAGERKDPLAFIFAGIVVMALLSGGLFRVGQTVVFAKDGGLLRLYAATPLPKWLYGISLSTSSMIIALLQAVILLGLGVVIFSIDYKLNLLVLLPLILASLSFSSLGFLAGGIARTRETFFAVINLLNMFLLFFSSVFYDIYSVGGIVAKVARIMPTSAAADALRKILMTGSSSSEKFLAILPQLGILFAWSFLAYLLATFTFKWSDEV